MPTLSVVGLLAKIQHMVIIMPYLSALTTMRLTMQPLAYCLQEGKLKLEDVDHIALNQDNRANLVRKAVYFAVKRPRISLVLKRLANRRKRESVTALLSKDFAHQRFRGQLHHVEHH